MTKIKQKHRKWKRENKAIMIKSRNDDNLVLVWKLIMIILIIIIWNIFIPYLDNKKNEIQNQANWIIESN